MKIYEQVEARTIEAEDFLTHGVHLGPQPLANITVLPGANVYPVALRANAAGRLVAVAETFGNAAWKSIATVIVPSQANQRPALSNILKSELQEVSAVSNAFGFTADLQPFGNVNTNSAVTDSPPRSIQLSVSNCAQMCNVYFTLA